MGLTKFRRLLKSFIPTDLRLRGTLLVTLYFEVYVFLIIKHCRN